MVPGGVLKVLPVFGLGGSWGCLGASWGPRTDFHRFSRVLLLIFDDFLLIFDDLLDDFSMIFDRIFVCTPMD